MFPFVCLLSSTTFINEIVIYIFSSAPLGNCICLHVGVEESVKRRLLSMHILSDRLVQQMNNGGTTVSLTHSAGTVGSHYMDDQSSDDSDFLERSTFELTTLLTESIKYGNVCVPVILASMERDIPARACIR